MTDDKPKKYQPRRTRPIYADALETIAAERKPIDKSKAALKRGEKRAATKKPVKRKPK
jgi:hypothetical protein